MKKLIALMIGLPYLVWLTDIYYLLTGYNASLMVVCGGFFLGYGIVILIVTMILLIIKFGGNSFGKKGVD